MQPSINKLAYLVSVVALCSGCKDPETRARPRDSGLPDAGVAQRDSGQPDAGAHESTFEAKPTCSDGDCNSSSHCVEFGDAGPSTCRSKPHSPTDIPSEIANECFRDADCAEESRCVGIVKLAVQCSSTSGGDGRNICVRDECTSDDDCNGGVCTPDGFDEARHCIAASCHKNADCDDEPGGVCLILEGGCCGMVTGGRPMRRPQLACAYPSDGCQTAKDCAAGTYCVAEAGRAHCGECNAENSTTDIYPWGYPGENE